MRIQQVKIKDFKAITDLEEDIAGNNIFVLGENGVGKSSFIQFIEIALGKTTDIPPNAHGSGVVIADKDGNQITFTVNFKAGKPVITVESDGLKDNRKSALAGLVGAMDFDVDAFAEMSKTAKGRKDQVEIFKSFLPAETREEIKKYEVHVQALFDERTELGRHIRETKAIVDAHPLRNEMTLNKFKAVDTKVLMDQLKMLQETNAKLQAGIAKKNEIAKIIEANKEKLSKLKEELVTLEAATESLIEREKAATDWIFENKLVDTSEVQQQIEQASEINTKASQATDLISKRSFLTKMEEENEDLTVRINTERQSIQDAIKDMVSPVEGLSYTEDQLLYKGIPVSPDSLSTSEIMELGVKLKMAENPELGILFIQRGESLGKDRLKNIIDLANKNNWQVIMEQVERGTEKLRFEIINA